MLQEPSRTNEYEKISYRTKNKAGDTAVMPKKLLIITLKGFDNALNFYPEGKAYLKRIKVCEDLKIEGDEIKLRGFNFTKSDEDKYVVNDVSDFGSLSLVSVIFSIYAVNKIKDGSVTVYLPELFTFVGKEKVSSNEIQSLCKNFENLKSLVGVLDGKYIPVLSYFKIDSEKNTITFSSPYVRKLYAEIEKARIVNEKKNKKPKLLPAYSYLVKPSIYNERDKRAVETVFTIVKVIEQAGKNVPHLSAETIVNRNKLLRDALTKTKSISDRNKLLKRFFKNVWKMIRTQTDIENTYSDIKLPDPDDKNNIPTMSRLKDTVFEFQHNGKNKETSQMEKEVEEYECEIG